MSIVRRFLVAPSLVRLIRKERGGSRVMEGYFAPQAGRTSFVRVQGQDCHLVLVATDAEGRASEERTEVPRAHGDALLDVCSGKTTYERTTVPIGGRDAVIDRYVVPAGLDLVSVAFDDTAAAQAFTPPAWFGDDVTANAAYDRHAVAIGGVPAAGEANPSNAALDAVLDMIEPSFGFGNLRKPQSTWSPTPAAAAPSPTNPSPLTLAAEVEPVTPAPHAAAELHPEPPALVATEPQPEAVSAPAAHDDAKPEPRLVPKPADDKADARIDDVIESLSAALSAAIQQPREPTPEEEADAPFERWTVRPRRSNQQN